MNKFIDKRQLIEFGLLIGFGFPLLIGWLLPTILGHPFRLWTLSVSLFSVFSLLWKPTLLRYPYRFWMALGHILGWLNSRILLSIIFIFMVIPISIIMKTLGHDPLGLNRKKLESFKVKPYNSKNFTNMF